MVPNTVKSCNEQVLHRELKILYCLEEGKKLMGLLLEQKRDQKFVIIEP